ncbi:hypothetical protein GCM10010523_32030 [Paenarthrobacter ilicis]
MFVGKHHDSDRAVKLIRAVGFHRVLIAGSLAMLAFLAFGFQPLNGTPAGNVGGSLAQGFVGPNALGTLLPPEAETLVIDPAPEPPEQQAGIPMVYFDRAMVRTVSKDGSTGLTVAAAGMSRPPAGALYAPLEVLNPSSPYGYRYSPLTGLAGEFHWGQDYAAACGTRVYAADAGIVRAVGWHVWGGGNRVEIEHGNGLVTTYNHLQAIGVTTGQSVRVGEVIAEVGTTGWSTGCHLHFETIVNGLHTNPNGWTYLPMRQVDPLQNITMVNYQPGAGAATTAAPVWAVPVADGTNRAVIGGDHEEPVARPVTPPATAPPASSQPPGQTTAPTPNTTAPSPSGTATPSPSTTATPSPSATATPSPSTTATPSPSATATPSPSTTATPTPSPSTTAAPSVAAPAPATTAAPVTTIPPAATVAPAVTVPPAVTVAPKVAPVVPTTPAPVPSAPLPSAIVPSALPSVILPQGYVLVGLDQVRRPDGVVVPLSSLILPTPKPS